MACMGRPTKYSDAVIGITKNYYDWCVENDECPFAEALAMKIGVNDSTLWHWANRHEDFREAYEILMTLQKLVLIKKGLSGEYVSSTASLLLLNSIKKSQKCQNSPRNNQIEDRLEKLTPIQRKHYSDLITKIFERIYSQPAVVY